MKTFTNDSYKAWLVLIGFFLITNAFSQEQLFLKIPLSKTRNGIILIIPYKEAYVYERYVYNTKFATYLSLIDTLKKRNDTTFVGKHVMINPKEYSFALNQDDSTVNRIRNMGLKKTLLDKVDRLAREEIGLSYTRLNKLLYKDAVELQNLNLPHSQFQTVGFRWREQQTTLINEVKQNKINRLDKIRSNSHPVDTEFIKSFLTDYTLCETDQLAVMELILNHPDEFLTACKELDDLTFSSAKGNLSGLPDNQTVNEAIAKLEASPVRTKRKAKVIRVMKRHIPL